MTDARLALRDVELRARLTPEEGRELSEANRAISQTAALDRKGDPRQAVAHAARALEIRQRILGNDHRDTATNLYWVATLDQEMGHYTKAEPLFRQASAIDKKVLGDQHPIYAASLNNLAELYREKGA
jgi:tetratricopeptide (TPR) repeat protein